MANVGSWQPDRLDTIHYIHKLAESRVGEGYSVISGCDVHEKGIPDMDVVVDSGEIFYGDVYKTVAGNNVTISAANGTNDRIDVIYVDSSGVAQVHTGDALPVNDPLGNTVWTQYESPYPKTGCPAGVIIALVYVPANDTSIENAQIEDIAQYNLGALIDDFAPATHASQHKSGGADAIKLDELAPPTDVSTLNASTSAHGLLKKLDNDPTHFMNGQGNWATPSGGGSIDLTSLPEITSLDEDDLLLVYDDSASANKKFKATPVVYARAYTNEPYIPHNSATIVNFANVVLDTHSAITTGASWKFTAPKSGYYTISAIVSFKDEHTTGRTPDDNGIITLGLYVNGTLRIEFPWTHVDSAMSEWLRPGVSGSFTLYLAASSYVQMKVTQNFIYNGGSGTDLVASHISILGR